jgi:hypothetical protein
LVDSTLSAYIPIDRLQSLATGEGLPDRELGAALYADISGFTALAESLVAALGPRDGADDPLGIYLTCYHVLRAGEDARADGLLSTAHTLLQARASKIRDEALRRSYLENVPSHRAVLAAWAAR